MSFGAHSIIIVRVQLEEVGKDRHRWVRDWANGGYNYACPCYLAGHVHVQCAGLPIPFLKRSILLTEGPYCTILLESTCSYVHVPVA